MLRKIITLQNEDMPYILRDVIPDILKNEVIVRFSRYYIMEYWRRNERYDVVYENLEIRVPFSMEFIASMTQEEKVEYLKNNWGTLLELQLKNVYPNMFFIKNYGIIIESTFKYFGDEEELLSDKLVASYTPKAMMYLNNLFPELKGIHVYNGYNLNDYKFCLFKK